MGGHALRERCTSATVAPASARVTATLSPTGRVSLVEVADGPAIQPDLLASLHREFSRGTGHGILHLAGEALARALPPALAYWREIASRYVATLCAGAGSDGRGGVGVVPSPPADVLAALADSAPPMVGAEYLDAGRLAALWIEIDLAAREEQDASGMPLEDFLVRLNPAWHLVGRVHFHLAENRKDEAAPFAFLATYATRLSSVGTAQHLPLGRALEEFAGAVNRERLLRLLRPVQRAGEACAWVKALADSGEVFHPLRWTPADAVAFLRDVGALESAGIVVRLPATWRGGRPARAQVTATVGEGPPSTLGADALLDFRSDIAVDGEVLTAAEVAELLRSTTGLALIRGQWVEVDADRVRRNLDRFREIERLSKRTGLTFAAAARLLSGADVGAEAPEDDRDRDWARVVGGRWLSQTLSALRSPERAAEPDLGADLRGTLRPYQAVGVRWLHLLAGLGLGACLADDMGLGKTVQVIALVLARRRERGRARAKRAPSLLVAPASLLANWAAELERFAPTLSVFVAHPSMTAREDVTAPKAGRLTACDVVVTSYGSLRRLPWITASDWDLVVLDEAQAIKNPGARQTRAAKTLSGRARIALTGTPIENRLGDLWSLFDFLNPGLLGSASQFTAFTRRLAAEGPNAHAPLRSLVRPYILRRMKTDRSIVPDLPDKTEVKAYCPLSRRQVALYAEAVEDLRRSLADVEGIARRGVVLASLTRLKQICNHPSQWLGDGAWAESDSGKWGRLREIAEVVAARQEKALVFTQFRETTAPLAAFLEQVFGRKGVVLDGHTPVAARRDIVARFQEDEQVPYFVLSLKAGGTGLNLTAASHVIHVDRWWNPAVEDQATDRAFRIGQSKNVLVHKFVCRGTVEERVDALIESKKSLARDILDGTADAVLTELPDEDLLRIIALDVRSAAMEI